MRTVQHNSTLNFIHTFLDEEKKVKLCVFLHEKGDRVGLQLLLPFIWSNKKHQKSIQTKAYAVESIDDHSGQVLRRPPMAHDLYTLFSDTPELLRKWCHRDPEAKKQLEVFLKTHWDTILALPKRLRISSTTKRTIDLVDQIFVELEQVEMLDCLERVENKLSEIPNKIDQIKRRKLTGLFSL